MYHLFSRWCLIESPSQDKIVESVVASHLARKYCVGYWRNGSEIDVVTKNEISFEVKWRKNAKPSRIRVGKIKNVVTLSKDNISMEPLMIPVYLFLACLDV
ncbi:hypothetical protein [Thermococcus sp. MV5]|uniref:hypothetical protein n=1 Tax=Thermococcus sp. MV5 TaxID=1638272 RepID=UPI001F0D1C94|nr:hypothetical protein [Thermococcus sp. MV5]